MYIGYRNYLLAKKRWKIIPGNIILPALGSRLTDIIKLIDTFCSI